MIPFIMPRSLKWFPELQFCSRRVCDQRLSTKQMYSARQVQIRIEAVCVSLCANALGKGIDQSILTLL